MLESSGVDTWYQPPDMLSKQQGAEMSEQRLETLLDLDGISYGIGGGYWVKFDITAVSPNAHIPHGVKYSLSLIHI